MEETKIFDRKRHQERKDLAGEYIWGDLGQLLLLGIFLSTWISDTFFFHFSDDLAHYVSALIRIPAGIIMLLISGYLARTSLKIVFGEERETPGVIRKGMFGRVRHPIYLGVILFYPGLLILRFSLAAIVIWIGIIAFYHYIARHEEQLLLQKFGQEYEDYMREVPMWIPRIR